VSDGLKKVRNFPERTDEKPWNSGSVGLQVLTQKLLNTKQKCQPLDVILTINNYDIFQNTSQVMFVMGW
jgi:hypothetical protein